MCKYYKFALALSQHLPNVSDSDSEHAPESKLVSLMMVTSSLNLSVGIQRMHTKCALSWALLPN